MSVARGATARTGAVLAIVLVCLALPQAASAASRVCRQLETELAAARGGAAGSAQYRKYDRAVSTQSQQIAIARRQARDAGCGFSILGGKSVCAVLDDRIGKMERNLAALQGKRAQLASGGGSRRNRVQILAELDANGCRGKRLAEKPRQRVVEQPEDNTSLFDLLPGRDARSQDEASRAASPALGDDPGSGIWRRLERNGHVVISGPIREFRTFCVRTCDGYFYPMSNASSQMDFDRDQKNCESSCPGSQVELYRQSIAEDSDAMVSAATGVRYADLPTAYLYKTEGRPLPPACGCSPAKNFSVVAGNPPRQPASAAPTAGGSIIRPDPASAAENPAEAATTPDTSDQAASHEMGERKVRVVGPTFLPDPEAAIDLRAPAQKKAR